MTTSTQLPGAEDVAHDFRSLNLTAGMVDAICEMIEQADEDEVIFFQEHPPWVYVFEEQIDMLRNAIDPLPAATIGKIEPVSFEGYPSLHCVRFHESHWDAFSEALGENATAYSFIDDYSEPNEEEDRAADEARCLAKLKELEAKIKPRRKVVALPKNLAVLGKVAPADSTARYTMSSVRLKINGHRYRCEVTDGRFLAVVRGPFYQGATGKIGSIERAWSGDGAKDVIIGRDDWLEVFKLIPTKRTFPKIEGVALSLCTKGSGAACDGKTIDFLNVEGRYPEVNQLFKDASSQPVAVGKLGVEQLEKILAVANGLGMTTLDVAFYEAGQQVKPFAISGQNAEGQILDVLAMPLSGGK